MANTYTKGYQDGTALTEAQLDTAITSFQLGLDKTANLTTGATANYVLTASTPASAATWAAIPDLKSLSKIRNYGISAAAAAGALTISLKSAAGTDPTSTDQVTVSFGTPAATSSVISELAVASALSITINASATLGISGTSSNNVYLYALKNSSANMALGVSFKSDLDQTYRTVTQISASADSQHVLYSSVASTASNSVRLLGRVLAAKNSSQQWQTPTQVQVMNGYAKNVALSAANTATIVVSTSPVDITNLTCTLTTRGNPVMLFLQSAETTSGSDISVYNDTTGANGAIGIITLVRDSTNVASWQFTTPYTVSTEVGTVFPGPTPFIDTPSAGTYTWKIQGNVNNAAHNMGLSAFKLVAYEL